ncbi:MAG: BAX inhibitor (BI)-1/YccA family protein, partial [Spirochaetota bacterium]
MSETERLYKRNAGKAGAVTFDEGLRRYMLGVYNYMAMGVAATALIAFAFLSSPAAMQTVAGL